MFYAPNQLYAACALAQRIAAKVSLVMGLLLGVALVMAALLPWAN